MLERRSSFEMITAVGAGVMVATSIVVVLVLVGGPDALIKTVHDSLTQMVVRGQDFNKLLGLPAIPADTQASAGDLAHDAFVAGFRAARRRELDAAQLARFLAMGRAAAAGIQPVWRSFAMVARGLDGVRMLASGFGLFIPVSAISAIALNGFICIGAVYFCRDWRLSDSIFSRSRSLRIRARHNLFCGVGATRGRCAGGRRGRLRYVDRLPAAEAPSPEANNLGDFF